MSKVSAVISAYNEESNIETCLKSLRFADEVIVVDNSSTDSTAEIAKKYTKNVFSQKNDPQLIDIQKNFGFEKATSDWILSIDADEEVSKELAEEIKSTINNRQSTINGYWIPRVNIIFGKEIKYTGWYPDPQLRLFRKGKGKFVKTHVHEPIELEGESAYLTKPLIHHHYRTIFEFMNRTINIYAPSEAQNYLDHGYQLAYLDAIRFPLNEFLSRFFARKGYKDGLHGFVLSVLMSFYHFIVFCLIWEKRGFKEYGKENFEKDIEKEFRKAGKEIVYWMSKEKIEALENPIKRNLQKISERIRNL